MRIRKKYLIANPYFCGLTLIDDSKESKCFSTWEWRLV